MPFDLDRLLARSRYDETQSERRQRRRGRLPRLATRRGCGDNNSSDEEEEEKLSPRSELKKVREDLERSVLRGSLSDVKVLLPKLYALGGKVDENEHRALCKGLQLHSTSLLHFTAESGFAAGLNYMLSFDREAMIDACDAAHFTPLHRACEEGQTAAVEVLLRHGACIYARTKRLQHTPLHVTVIQHNAGCGPLGEKYLKVIEQLMCRGSRDYVNIMDGRGQDVQSIASTASMKVALNRTPWEPALHPLFPSSFRHATRLILLASGSSQAGGGGFHHLSRDLIYTIIAMSAHPLGDWVKIQEADRKWVSAAEAAKQCKTAKSISDITAKYIEAFHLPRIYPIASSPTPKYVGGAL